FIEVYGVRRLDDVVEVVLGNAADGELGVLAGKVAGDVHTRCEGCDIEALLYTERLQLLAGEGAHRDTDVLDVLLALLRGHNNLLEYVLCVERHCSPKSKNGGCSRGAARVGMGHVDSPKPVVAPAL